MMKKFNIANPVKLTDGELNQYLGLLMGWKMSPIRSSECQIPVLINGKDFYVNWQLPHYTGDLNETHKVEQLLFDKQEFVRAVCNYHVILYEVVTGQRFNLDGNWLECIHATAWQKSIAIYLAVERAKKEAESTGLPICSVCNKKPVMDDTKAWCEDCLRAYFQQ